MMFTSTDGRPQWLKIIIIINFLALPAIFGKCLQSTRNRFHINFATTKDQLKRYVSKPTFCHAQIITKDLVAIKSAAVRTTLNSPIQVGFAVLELSKRIMFKFHYKRFLPRFPTSTLMYTDTDSLFYAVTSMKPITEGLLTDQRWYDFSNMPSNHPLYDPSNMKVVGKFKDELAGQPMAEFIALKPKVYALKFGNKEKKVAKGIPKAAVRQSLEFKDFQNQLAPNPQPNVIRGKGIRSYFHQLYTIETTRQGLNPVDDKRYLLTDGISTRAHGHWQNFVQRPDQVRKQSQEAEFMFKRQKSDDEPAAFGRPAQINPTKQPGNSFDKHIASLPRGPLLIDPGFTPRQVHEEDEGEGTAVRTRTRKRNPFICYEAKVCH
jgi:hypothetical protein